MQIVDTEIMEEPRYIDRSWQNVFQHVRFSDYFAPQNILSFYKSVLLTNRKVFALFEENLLIDLEKYCFDHLKQYMKNLTPSGLHKLLRFMIGADIISVEKNKVSSVIELINFKSFVKKPRYRRRQGPPESKNFWGFMNCFCHDFWHLLN